MKFFIIILITLFSLSAVAQDCSFPRGFESLESIERLSSQVGEATDQIGVCSEVPLEDRKKTNEAEIGFPTLMANMAKGCLVGLVKGIFSGIKDIVTSIWGIAKLGFKLAKKFGEEIVDFLYAAYKGTVASFFAEKAATGSKFISGLIDSIKSIPEALYGIASKSIEGFGCLNGEAKTQLICKGIGYVGTDIVIGVLTGGLSKAALVGKLGRPMQLVSRGMKARKLRFLRKAKLLKRKGMSALSTKILSKNPIIKGPNAKRAFKKYISSGTSRKNLRKIDQLEKSGEILKIKLFRQQKKLAIIEESLSKAKSGSREFRKLENQVAKQNIILRRTTKSLVRDNSKKSHLLTKKKLKELDDLGIIEIDRIHVDGKTVNAPLLEAGRYPPWTEGGPVFDIRVKKKFEACRGGPLKDLTKKAGRWFLPCLTKDYKTKEDSKWRNATADNNYDVFVKYNLKVGDELQVGGLNPLLDDRGFSLSFFDKKYETTSVVQGGGGEIQFFRPSRDTLTSDDITRWVRGLDDPKLLRIQEKIATAQPSSLRKLQSKLKKMARVSDEAKYLLEEIAERLTGIPKQIPSGL